MAELFIDLSKLSHNIQTVHKQCIARSLKMVGIVKGCYTFSPIIRTFQQCGVDLLGISRVNVGIESCAYLSQRPILISLPSRNETQSVIRYFQASLNSEVSTIKGLAAEAKEQNRRHGIILMVDNGDLREGVMPDDVMDVVRQILEIDSSGIKLAGIGANLGCCSGMLPNEDNVSILQELSDMIEGRFGFELETISIGGSLMLKWMQDHVLPAKINQIRIGEAVMLGNIPSYNIREPDLYDDVFIMAGEVLEVKLKPSQPVGVTGADALGSRKTFLNRGIRKRAILNFGVVDTDPTGLFCVDPGVEFISCNSDYTVVDVTDCERNLKLGDHLYFKLNYSAMIQAFMSPFVRIILVDDVNV